MPGDCLAASGPLDNPFYNALLENIRSRIERGLVAILDADIVVGNAFLYAGFHVRVVPTTGGALLFNVDAVVAGDARRRSIANPLDVRIFDTKSVPGGMSGSTGCAIR